MRIHITGSGSYYNNNYHMIFMLKSAETDRLTAAKPNAAEIRCRPAAGASRLRYRQARSKRIQDTDINPILDVASGFFDRRKPFFHCRQGNISCRPQPDSVVDRGHTKNPRSSGARP